jgi:hypothetical protein
MIGAHHDAITRYPNSFYDTAPGADDNASGTAGVLEIARIFKQHYNGNLPLHFATWTGEETGILGSESYVERYAVMDSLPVFYINLDMIANQTSATPQMNYYYDDIFAHTYEYIENYTDLLIHHLPPSGAAGDNWPFEDANVPFVYFQEYDFSEEYHYLSDVVDNCEMPFAHKMVQGALAVTWNMCGAFPETEITSISHAGNGTEFSIQWTPIENIAYYHLQAYDGEELVKSIKTTEDSVRITDMPLNATIRVTLQKTSNDSIKGFLHQKYIELDNQPPVYEMSASMNFTDITLTWSGAVQEDLLEFILNRRPNGATNWEVIETFDTNVFNKNIANHTEGIWEYMISVKDNEGNATQSETCFVYSTETKNDVMIISGQLGGYNNPSHANVLSFYENIMTFKDHHLYQALIDRKYLPLMQNMEAVIWNAFSSNMSNFYTNIDLIKTYLENGGKVLLFGKNPQLHFDANYETNQELISDYWVNNLGIESIVINDGAKLKQLLHPSGITANVDPAKVPASFAGTLPNIDVPELNENASSALTFQSLSSISPDNNFDNEPIAFKHVTNEGMLFACGVPLYYFDEDEAKILLKEILEDDMLIGIQPPGTIISNIDIYPSPADKFIYVSLPADQSFSGTCSIYDVAGKKVKSTILNISNGQNVKLPVHLLETGVYVLQLNGTENYTGKFIKE